GGAGPLRERASAGRAHLDSGDGPRLRGDRPDGPAHSLPAPTGPGCARRARATTAAHPVRPVRRGAARPVPDPVPRGPEGTVAAALGARPGRRPTASTNAGECG